MKTFLSQIKNICIQSALKAFPGLSFEEIQKTMEVTESRQEQFGHYQCNAAMKLAKILGQNPRAIATALNEELKNTSFFTTTLAGPGFINFTLTSDTLSKSVTELLKAKHLNIEIDHLPSKVVIDFSSPNIAKEMHVGHLRSTIIGDCLARLFEFLGSNVLRLNHIGDWGTQFGMLITYMREEKPDVLSGKEETDLPHLMEWYKASKIKFDQDAEFKERSQKQVVALQAGNKEALESWKMICEISAKGYREIYNLLDVKIIDRGESFYNEELPKVIKDLEERNFITLSDGAKCLFLEGFINRDGDPLPLMIQKSDGGYNYATTDLAALKQRVLEEKAERIIYVIDAGQSQHMQMIFQAGKKVGYVDPEKVRLDHVAFGLVLGSDGKKFKTRSGETEKLIDLLKTAIDKALEILNERELPMEEDEKKQLAKALGIGAVKYADLSCNRIGDYHFSYDKMLKFEGNTAAFQMYSYVRVAGIKRKIGANIQELLQKGEKITLFHEAEISLALHLLQFPETLEAMAEELLPNRLTDYLYQLAQKFNAFFRDCRVEGSEEENSRLLLAEAVARVMENGFHILGIQCVTRM